MRFDVITLFPELLESLIGPGVTGRALESGKATLALTNPRDFALDRHRSVDDRPYGGGPGMVMLVEPLRAAIKAVHAMSPDRAPVICLSPQGERLTQAKAASLARLPRVILLCGRYEGIDERIIEAEVDEELSIGDYVLSGGELAAAVVIDAVTRLLPEVLGHQDSAEQDSFVGNLLDCPHYSRPEVVDEQRVPGVLLTGDHGKIERWRLKQALGRTWLRRPDLLPAAQLTEDQQKLLEEFQREYRAEMAPSDEADNEQHH